MRTSQRVVACVLLSLATAGALVFPLASGPNASAQTPRLGWVCPGGGVGCYDCLSPQTMSPGGSGCDQTNPATWQWGSCVSGAYNQSCLDQVIANCGRYKKCVAPFDDYGPCQTIVPMCK